MGIHDLFGYGCPPQMMLPENLNTSLGRSLANQHYCGHLHQMHTSGCWWYGVFCRSSDAFQIRIDAAAAAGFRNNNDPVHLAAPDDRRQSR